MRYEITYKIHEMDYSFKRPRSLFYDTMKSIVIANSEHDAITKFREGIRPYLDANPNKSCLKADIKVDKISNEDELPYHVNFTLVDSSVDVPAAKVTVSNSTSKNSDFYRTSRLRDTFYSESNDEFDDSIGTKYQYLMYASSIMSAYKKFKKYIAEYLEKHPEYKVGPNIEVEEDTSSNRAFGDNDRIMMVEPALVL